MLKDARRDDPRNCNFDAWLRANAVVGSILATAIFATALASFYSAGRPIEATEFSSITSPK